tara:strand:+ start:1466 stop:1969 length:504 start_codon:yes stop_codon:yes gene_type:complete
MTTVEILKIVGLSLTGATLINGILYKYWLLPKINKDLKSFESKLKREESINENRWQIKRNACLNALNIADALLSNYEYPNAKKEDIKPGKITTEEVRTCFNELAASCSNSDVIDILKKIMYESVSPDIIVDLRNAVRQELEFGKDDFDKDRDKAFVGKIGADPELKK